MSGPLRNQRERIDVGPGTNRRKTGHVTRACNTCRRKKSRCDGNQPVCRACNDSGHECTWTAEEDSRRPATKQYVESLKNTNKFQAEHIKALEAKLAAHGLTVDNMGTDGTFNPASGSPGAGLFGSAPLPSTSQAHSPAGSFTGADLPAEAFLNPNNDVSYDSHSDSESVAENLSNAASRLVISDGDLAAVGPSSLQFHRPSPITRTVPLEDVPGDAPKHTLHLSDDAPASRSHSRNPSASYNRSRSRSQTRSAGHSRASSVSPHGITPPPQTQGFNGATSSPAHALFQNLSPPTAGSAGVPYLDAGSPGSDSFGTEQAAIDQILAANRDHLSPNAYGDDEEEDRYDWKQMLPQDVDLTRTEHDTLLDIFFKVFSSWCYRTIPDLFLRDMRRYLEGTRTVKVENSQSPSEEKVITTGPKAVHYTPMLHNAILSLALAYSDDPKLSKRSTRARFVEQAKSTLETECARPSLACVHALAYIASFYSGEGEQTLGFLFFGMSIRMSQALGLSIDCSSWVRSGHISSLDEIDRVWTYWSAYSLDKCWAFYVGRDHGLPQPLLKVSQKQPPLPHSDSSTSTQSASSQNSTFVLSTIRSPGAGPVAEINYPAPDEKADNSPWEWKAPGNWSGGNAALSRRTVANTPSGISSAFYQTCKLMVLATRVMNAIWNLPRNASSESISPLALEVDQWLEELPDSMRINRPKNTQALPHILMINMAHQWLQIILHRPFYTLTQNKSDQSIKRCDSGAEKILQYLAAWRRLYELRYVPITMVQIAFIAGTTCLLKAIQSTNMPEKRRTSLEGVTEIIRALSEMGATWKSALQSAEALKVLRREQVSVNERSPGPSRHPTVELQPPSRANSRMMDMTPYELHSSSAPFGGTILEGGGNVYAEPSSDLQMGDPFSGMYSAESPGSTHSGQYYSGSEGAQGHNQGHGHFVGGVGPDGNLGIPGMMHGGITNEGLYAYGQLNQFMGANDGRLRGGESFPNHPTGLFGGPGTQGPAEAPEWYGPTGYSFGGVPSQHNQQHQQSYWGQ